MLEIDVNAMILVIFVSATMKAAVHLGQDYQDNSRTTKNMDFEKVKQLVRYFTEFDPGPKSRDKWDVYMSLEHNSMDENSTLLNGRAVKLSKAKVCVFSVSVLCLGRIFEYPRSMDAWKEKIEWSTKFLNIVSWIVLMEDQSCSSGQFSQDTQNCSYFGKSNRRWRKTKFSPEQFEDRIIFMSMYNDIYWGKATRMSNFRSCGVRKTILQRTLVISRTRNSTKVVWNAHLQGKRPVEPRC